MLIKQIDRLLYQGSLTVFKMNAQFMQTCGMAIADPTLQTGMAFLFALHMLALALCIIEGRILFRFLTHKY
ncbi:hypothetical protein AE1304_04410 [Aeromonas enteropelogenes]